MEIVEMRLQAKEVTKIIVGSGFSNHYFTEKNGVVYICDKADFKKSVESGEYNAIGSVNTDNKAYREVTRELLSLFKSFSKKEKEGNKC